MSLVLAIDTSTPAVTAGVVADGRRVGRAGHRRRPRTCRADHPECLGRHRRCWALDGRPRCRRGRLRSRSVHRTTGRYGDRRGLRSRTGSSGARGLQPRCHRRADQPATVLVVTDARRREVYWARYRDGVRVDGPEVNAPADVDPGPAQSVAGSPDHAALFGLPCIEPSYPDAAGLVAAVADWSQPPAALVPLYLRRPDAKTLAERQAAGQ